MLFALLGRTNAPVQKYRSLTTPSLLIVYVLSWQVKVSSAIAGVIVINDAVINAETKPKTNLL